MEQEPYDERIPRKPIVPKAVLRRRLIVLAVIGLTPPLALAFFVFVAERDLPPNLCHSIDQSVAEFREQSYAGSAFEEFLTDQRFNVDPPESDGRVGAAIFETAYGECESTCSIRWRVNADTGVVDWIVGSFHETCEPWKATVTPAPTF